VFHLIWKRNFQSSYSAYFPMDLSTIHFTFLIALHCELAMLTLLASPSFVGSIWVKSKVGLAIFDLVCHDFLQFLTMTASCCIAPKLCRIALMIICSVSSQLIWFHMGCLSRSFVTHFYFSGQVISTLIEHIHLLQILQIMYNKLWNKKKLLDQNEPSGSIKCCKILE
jgi:hypothetical protein